MSATIQNRDVPQGLGADAPLRSRIREIYWATQSFMPFVARIAVAIYDPKSALLKTFVHSGDSDSAPPNYQAPAGKAPSLRGLLDKGHPRVIERMLTFENAETEYAKRLGRSGYPASYTLPMFSNGVFLGFAFFNSRDPAAFTEAVLAQLDIFGHLMSLMVIQDVTAIRTLSAALEGARELATVPDSETGSHLDRMSRYARIIARALAPRHGLDDETIERIQAYAPLHDIGNIGIPEAILLKPQGLTDDETAVVRTHSHRGQVIIDDLLTRFGLDSLADTDMVRNIALYHHERVDGRGYPYGLAGTAIPLEARIVATADVFDALTSRRPYKESFANEEAFAELERLAGSHLDAECVQALVDHRAEVERIQAQLSEAPLG
jgi:HD-GYP domain-containing protein (c-di-GMP phosphodiesterase class II)